MLYIKALRLLNVLHMAVSSYRFYQTAQMSGINLCTRFLFQFHSITVQFHYDLVVSNSC